MIEDNYDKIVKTQRLTDESGDTESYDDFITDLACTIQPLDESYSQDIDGNFGKDWLMFCKVSDILEGDRIVDGADQYKVIGVESFNFLGQPRHIECRIRKSNP